MKNTKLLTSSLTLSLAFFGVSATANEEPKTPVKKIVDMGPGDKIELQFKANDNQADDKLLFNRAFSYYANGDIKQDDHLSLNFFAGHKMDSKKLFELNPKTNEYVRKSLIDRNRCSLVLESDNDSLSSTELYSSVEHPSIPLVLADKPIISTHGDDPSKSNAVFNLVPVPTKNGVITQLVCVFRNSPTFVEEKYTLEQMATVFGKHAAFIDKNSGNLQVAMEQNTEKNAHEDKKESKPL